MENQSNTRINGERINKTEESIGRTIKEGVTTKENQTKDPIPNPKFNQKYERRTTKREATTKLRGVNQQKFQQHAYNTTKFFVFYRATLIAFFLIKSSFSSLDQCFSFIWPNFFTLAYSEYE